MNMFLHLLVPSSGGSVYSIHDGFDLRKIDRLFYGVFGGGVTVQFEIL